VRWAPPGEPPRGDAPERPPHALEVRLRAAEGPEAFTAWLHADGLGLLLLAGLLAQQPPRPGPLRSGVPLALHAELGCTHVTLQELHSLAPGDVVLVQRPF